MIRGGLLLLTVLLGSCATYNAGQIGKVKSIAIVSIGGRVESEGSYSLDPVSIRDVANSAYALVGKRLSKRFSWKILPLESVQKNKIYKDITHNGGFRSSEMSVKGLIDSDLFHGDRQKILKALGVDAIAFVHFDISKTSQSNLLGIKGSSYYAVKTRFLLYRKGDDDAIWVNYSASGETSDVKVNSWFGLNQKNEENRAILDAINHSLDELLH